MKEYEYKVIFFNGNAQRFYCNGFTEAIILGMSYAIQQGWDMRIKYVSDEQGQCVQDIRFPNYNYCK